MSIATALIGSAMLFTGFCAVVAIFSKPPRQKPQATRRIHLPRTPSWDRAAKYYSDTH